MEAIARLDGPQVIPFLLQTVQKEPHWDICEEAVKLLGHKGQPAVDSLVVLLPDSRPFVRTVAILELGRLKAVKAVPGILLALRDREQLVRSASLHALSQLGREDTPDLPKIITAMTAALDDKRKEEPVVRESALEGLAALAGKAGAQRQEIIQALLGIAEGRNPRLAKKAREILDTVYKATPAEIEKARRASSLAPNPGDRRP